MRSEEDILSGVVVVRIGGEEKPLRVLRIAEEKAWRKHLGSAVAVIANVEFDATDPNAIARLVGQLADQAGDSISELVLAYDVDGLLGGRENLEKSASSEEVYAAFRQILEVVAPFVRDAQSAMNYARTLLMQAVQSQPANSTSLPLPTGTSTPKRSRAA